MEKPRSLTVRGLQISLGVASVLAALHFWGEYSKTKAGHDPTWLQRMDLVALDTMFGHRGTQRPERWHVGIAAIDEPAIRSLGEPPWSRRIHAKLIRALSKQGAAAIAFDVMFPYPQKSHTDRGIEVARTAAVSTGLYEARAELAEAANALRNAKSSVEQTESSERKALVPELDQSIRSVIDATATATAAITGFRNELVTKVERVSPDQEFAKAIEEAGNVVLAVVQQSQEESEKFGIEELRKGLKRIRSSTISEYLVRSDSFDEIGRLPDQHFSEHYLRFFGVQSPTEVLIQSGAHLGSINAFPDADGVMRRFFLLSRPSQVSFAIPTLSLKAVAVAKGNLDVSILTGTHDTAPFGIEIGDLHIPLGEKSKAIINWYGSASESKLPVWSIADILDGRVDRSEIEGRIIFVAATALGTFDQRVSPLDRNIPGVYTHATLAQNILDRNFLRRPGYLFFVELSLLLFLGIFLGVVLIRVGVIGKILISLVTAAGWLVLCRFIFFDARIVVTTMVPMAQVFITLLGITLWRFLAEEREKRRTKQAFQRYLAPAVMEQVLTNPEEFLRLGGRKYDATVLFSDIRGFTTISERLSPEALGRLLNLYMTPMTNLVFEHGGTLDKYIGDAVMAFWGAPLVQSDHPVLACRTALRMLERVDALNQTFVMEGLPEIAIGIGLATGPMTIGNMGSDDFFAYTALGDRVNLGARLEGQTKEYGVEIIISEDCYLQSKDFMSCRELGAIQVKGKLEPVRIYELLGEGPLSAELNQFVQVFHAGLSAFRERKWGDAMRCFEKAHELRDGGDKTSLDYIQQCKAFEVNPPPANWLGIKVALSK
ncbi:MAG: adenylate/guanylate cyclase domain-containing protein [Myxococcota bacterium]|nr:adenylate/guanylate cyclase domain-containing protein [Myxococcota bacterium]